LKPGQVIVIRDFLRHFTVSQNRRNEGPLAWVAVKTKHDGKGFRRLMMHDHGQAIYCAFLLMVQVAAKCTNHGILADEDGPLSYEDLEVKTGCPTKVFREATDVLSGKGIEWVQLCDYQGALRSRSSQVDYVTDGTVRNEQSVRPDCGSEISKTGGDEDGADVDLPCLKRVTTKHLTETAALAQLATLIRSEQPGHIPDGDDGLLRLLAAAERSKSEGKNPPRLFRWIVRKQRWDVLDGNERQAAKRRLSEFREQTGGPRE
jgi:hypothetical protein